MFGDGVKKRSWIHMGQQTGQFWSKMKVIKMKQ